MGATRVLTPATYPARRTPARAPDRTPGPKARSRRSTGPTVPVHPVRTISRSVHTADSPVFRDPENVAVDFGHVVDYRYFSTQNPPQNRYQPQKCGRWDWCAARDRAHGTARDPASHYAPVRRTASRCARRPRASESNIASARNPRTAAASGPRQSPRRLVRAAMCCLPPCRKSRPGPAPITGTRANAC
jgi:hypothetical protein